jgi:outer membrane lipoprotein carrier protein
MTILHNVEKRYNSVSTLRANFTQTFKDRGRAKIPEKGVLYLNKKNHQTRWDYSAPAGNVFVSDNKMSYNYVKARNTVERTPVKETDDMRIPLGFLIGTLDFEKDFREFAKTIEGSNAVITARPKNQNLLFKEITMTIAPDYSIRRVLVLGQEGSTMEYVLEGEQRDVKLADALFHFTPPPGTQVVESRN